MSEDSKTKIAFVDCDGVLFEEGTDELFPGALDELKRLQSLGFTIVLFTCRPLTHNWIHKVRPVLINGGFYMQKPFADEYIYIDDKLNLEHCANELVPATESPAPGSSTPSAP